MLAAQLMRDDGKLLRARDLLADCEQQACDAAADAECRSIRSFCKQMLGDLVAEIPSVRVSVVDERGAVLPGATRRIGATVVGTNEAVQLDPGRHVLRAEYAGRSTVVDFDVVKGAPTQTLQATIDLRQTVASRPTPWPVWALGVTSAAGLMGFGVLAGATRAQLSELDACRPTCELSRRSTFQATTVGADVSLVVGLLAGLGAAVVYLARPRVERVEHVDPSSNTRASAP